MRITILLTAVYRLESLEVLQSVPWPLSLLQQEVGGSMFSISR